MTTTSAVPGRYVPANPQAISRLLSKAGLKSQRSSSGDGFSVRGYRVRVYNRLHPTRAQEALARAEETLAAAGYLVERTAPWLGAPQGELVVRRPVTTEEHAAEFLRSAWECKVVTDDGRAITATDDPGVQVEMQAIERAATDRRVAEEAAEFAAKARQESAVDRLRAAGATSSRASWQYSTKIEMSVEDAEMLLDQIERS